MTDRELMQQALEALEQSRVFVTTREKIKHPEGTEWYDERITALRERLAQPEQEPVAWGVFDGPNLHDVNFNEEEAHEMVRLKGDGSVVKPLYTSTQPQMQPCAGRNCGSTNPNLHSAECFEDYEKSTGMEQPEQEPVHVPVTDNTYNYAKNLAEAIFKQHFASDEHYASGRIVWGVNDTVIGILTQIDNMIADMVRRPAQPEQEPVAWRFRSGTWFNREVQWRYIDTLDGAEGLRGLQPLYTAPRQWQGLTDDVVFELADTNLYQGGKNFGVLAFAKAIEQALKEKNT